MKTEDIERLKEICEREGFEVTRSREGSILFHIKKKDPWQDVEFAELNTTFKNLGIFEGMVGKIIHNYHDGSIEIRMVSGSTCSASKKCFKPSTEQAYFEQLKKEAFERFGKIKEGDRFEMGWSSPSIVTIGEWKRWYYDKESDILVYGKFIIYQSGKWATRVPERVEITESELTGEAFWNVFKFRVKNSHMVKKSGEEIKEFLIDQLEKYLNV